MSMHGPEEIRAGGWLNWAFKGCAVLALLVGALLATLWLEHRMEVTLPTPTGPFAVSRTTYVWCDAMHADSFAPQPGTKRELLAWIWYPAVARQSPPTVEDYLPAPLRTATERGRVALINLLTRDLSRVRVHSIRDSDVSPQQRSYPVVVMMGSLGFTTLAEDLASHGYVVVSVEAPYRSGLVVFPDGRVIGRVPLACGGEQKTGKYKWKLEEKKLTLTSLSRFI